MVRAILREHSCSSSWRSLMVKNRHDDNDAYGEMKILNILWI